MGQLHFGHFKVSYETIFCVHQIIIMPRMQHKIFKMKTMDAPLWLNYLLYEYIHLRYCDDLCVIYGEIV